MGVVGYGFPCRFFEYIKNKLPTFCQQAQISRYASGPQHWALRGGCRELIKQLEVTTTNAVLRHRTALAVDVLRHQDHSYLSSAIKC